MRFTYDLLSDYEHRNDGYVAFSDQVSRRHPAGLRQP
jgi:hypothetical protein